MSQSKNEFKVKLFHQGPSFYSRAVRLALSECDINYEGVEVNMNNGITLQGNELLKFNPKFTVPTLVVFKSDGANGKNGSTPAQRNQEPVAVLGNTLSILEWIAQQRQGHPWFGSPEVKNAHQQFLKDIIEFPLDVFTYARMNKMSVVTREMVKSQLEDRMQECDRQLAIAQKVGDATGASLWKDKLKKNALLLDAMSDQKQAMELDQRVRAVVDAIEGQLSDNTGHNQHYLFGSQLTMSDLAAISSLYRLEELGCTDFWIGRNQLTHSYLKQFKKRESFKYAVLPYPFSFSSYSIAKTYLTTGWTGVVVWSSIILVSSMVLHKYGGSVYRLAVSFLNRHHPRLNILTKK
ncbi:hypothetical protein MIR68_002137 [Amoeboaphelidium protococcarum]|nr:hypothetical protein MIR68_002137 [Amoeboaphelidium protococcarum]